MSKITDSVALAGILAQIMANALAIAWTTMAMAALQAQPLASPTPAPMASVQQEHHISPQLLGQSLDDIRPSLVSIEVDDDYKSYEFDGKVYEHWRVEDRRGIEATLHTVDGMVLSMHITDSDYRTDAGVGMGDTFARVHEVYEDAKMVIDVCSINYRKHVVAANGQLVFWFGPFEKRGRKWLDIRCDENGPPDLKVSAMHIRMPEAASKPPLGYLGQELTFNDIKDHFHYIGYSLDSAAKGIDPPNPSWSVVDHQGRQYVLDRCCCHNEITGMVTDDHTFRIGGAGIGGTMREIRHRWPQADIRNRKYRSYNRYHSQVLFTDDKDRKFHISYTLKFEKALELKRGEQIDDKDIQNLRARSLGISANIPEHRHQNCVEYTP